MILLDLLQNLPLAAMFLATLAIGLALGGLVLAAVRFGVRRSGFDLGVALPIRDALMNAVGAIFALMVAFSAAGIWNDATQANTAVQRESNALENMLALAPSLPPEVAEKLKTAISAYTRSVAEKDWPAMVRKSKIDDPAYDQSDEVMLGVLNMVAAEQARLAGRPTASALIGEIVEARKARLARITVASAGVSAPQWVAMLLIALTATIVIALCHNQNARLQMLAVGLYVLAASAAFFVILAHDRPFVGPLAVSPAPIVHLTTAK